ncbi:MAG: hypothetical protein IOD12_02030 [Silvanigrellales bacterium]|nr:hypothetical protein [Silvanigrellales bacterium]
MEFRSKYEQKPNEKTLFMGIALGGLFLSGTLFACEPSDALRSRLEARFGAPPVEAAIWKVEGTKDEGAKKEGTKNEEAKGQETTDDSERASGPNQTRAGADALDVAGGPRTGAVSFQEGNRSNWYRLVLPDAGVYRIEFAAHEDAVGLDAEIFEDGLPRPLGSSETLEALRPRDLYVRVAAPEPRARGSYRLSVAPTSQPLVENVKGHVLRFNGTHATLDLGAEDGMKVGLRGLILRPNASSVEFVVKKVLTRSSSVEARTELKLADVGARARVTGTQETFTPSHRETRTTRE